jgi:hypothetical protein
MKELHLTFHWWRGFGPLPQLDLFDFVYRAGFVTVDLSKRPIYPVLEALHAVGAQVRR